MRKITLSALAIVAGLMFTNAQDINFNAAEFSSPDDGGQGAAFMNVSNLPDPDGDGAYQFGSGWGIADLVSILDVDANTTTLKPNRINDTDAYWQGDGTNLRGNKIMDANHYIQSADLNGNVINFNGSVVSNTVDNTGILPYMMSYTAFIKVFAPDFSSVLEEAAINLEEVDGDFTLTIDATGYTNGENIQYGFQVVGPNINIDSSFDAEYDGLGGITIGAANLSVGSFETATFTVFPNPANDILNISSSERINSVQVFDIAGKLIQTTSKNTVDTSGLNTGLYFARVTTDNAIETLRFTKQ